MIFLSAGIPDNGPENDFFTTSDFVAIRDAVRSLASVIIPTTRLVYGGQPAITSLIRYIMYKTSPEHKENVILYQSAYFEKSFPKDNEYIENQCLVPVKDTLQESLTEMRMEMINNHSFEAGIFIGGKKGVVEEYDIFKKLHPGVPVFPIASTGAAAKALYHLFDFSDNRLISDFAYKNLFKTLLTDII